MSQASTSGGDRASETGSLDNDLGEQAENLDRGVASMPIDAAKSSIARWKGALGSLKVDGTDRVIAGLDELSSQLAGGKPDGAKIATILAKLGQDVGTIATTQSSAVAAGLRALSKSLTAAGSKLVGGRTTTH